MQFMLLNGEFLQRNGGLAKYSHTTDVAPSIVRPKPRTVAGRVPQSKVLTKVLNRRRKPVIQIITDVLIVEEKHQLAHQPAFIVSINLWMTHVFGARAIGNSRDLMANSQCIVHAVTGT